MLKKLFAVAVTVLLVAACQTKPAANSNANGAGANGAAVNGAVVPGSQADLEANVGDRAFFALNSSVLSSEAQATLGRQAAWLKTNAAVKVTVEGHADERGTREFNLALGERRATAAKNFLVSAGVAANRVATISYGKERPAVVGSSEEAWAQNRRAVTVVTQ
jgi:peptidoglycan-associated lipoprotein